MLIFLLSVARADLPPPPLKKYASYAVVVHGLGAHPEHVVVVYPWSNSNGVPMAELVQLIDGQPLRFGRRIDGSPAFYALKRAELEAWSAAGSGDVAALLAGGVRCEGSISPRHLVSKVSPGDIIDEYTLTSLSEGECEITLDGRDRERRCQAAPGGGLLALLGVLLGLRSRRRR